MNISIPGSNDFLAILPYLVLTVSAILFLVFQFVFKTKERLLIRGLSLFVVALSIYFVYDSTSTPGLGRFFQNQIKISELTTWLNILYLLVAFFTILATPQIYKNKIIDFPEFFPLVLFATVGMMFMTSGQDLLVIFIGLEIMSLSLYILVGMGTNSTTSLEATMKYFLLGAFSSGFMLLGIAFLFGGSGSTDLETALRPIAQSGYQANFTRLGFSLFLIGVFFKIALVPFHSWTPDVYEGSMTTVTGFMASAPKAAGMSLLMILFMFIPFGDKTSFWTLGLGILSIVSMTWGNIVALKQKNLKRILAYSSISHAGYVVAGIVAGANLEVLYYLYIYAIMNIAGFSIIAYLEDTSEIVDLDGIGNLISKKPWVAFGISLVFLSMAGFPPLAGFWAKLFLFQKIAESELMLNQVLLVVGVINSAIAFFYYAKVLLYSFMIEKEGLNTSKEITQKNFGIVITMIIGVVFIGLAWLVFQPASFL
ncbi:NADH-quinone oxidoreductase subunit N [Leptospira sp. GIMC2001]|uniref:NADH-quinone oxidoreductase subunit N n=1 Tax=Leptospira sp. GIMC2001 TaxID=1513297 RepID=UPI00234A6108|nr:NADH-quinone oxidoreductase subunit N [Leptospira sp. GIMC2001]WCL48188.1 NADH-quinone oxidoreductase subunit N [Leptospira sp. GIMC2001]